MGAIIVKEHYSMLKFAYMATDETSIASKLQANVTIVVNRFSLIFHHIRASIPLEHLVDELVKSPALSPGNTSILFSPKTSPKNDLCFAFYAPS